jgi:hypothetical protein
LIGGTKMSQLYKEHSGDFPTRITVMDHNTKCFEIKEILSMEKSRLNDLVEITIINHLIINKIRTIICSPTCKFLTSTGEYIKATELKGKYLFGVENGKRFNLYNQFFVNDVQHVNKSRTMYNIKVDESPNFLFYLVSACIIVKTSDDSGSDIVNLSGAVCGKLVNS